MRNAGLPEPLKPFAGQRSVSKTNNLLYKNGIIRYYRVLFFGVGKTFWSTDSTIQPPGDRAIQSIHIYSKQQST